MAEYTLLKLTEGRFLPQVTWKNKEKLENLQEDLQKEGMVCKVVEV
jgi:hypothetical protein